MADKRSNGLEFMLAKKMSMKKAQKLLDSPRASNFIIEPKYDGVRACIRDGKLYNRRGVEITDKFPEFRGIEHIKGTWDGEVIACSEEFEDTASRIHTKDKFQIRLLSKKVPAKFMCFDCINTGRSQSNGMMEYLGSQTLMQRRKRMLETSDFRAILPWFQITPQRPLSELDSAWDDVVEYQREGIMVKDKMSGYRFGSRSGGWFKVKAWEETVAEFPIYEEHPKGITIETADGRRVVVNGAQAEDVKQAIDDNGSVMAEIQFLPQKNSDAWRFPSFKRIQGGA